MNQKILVAGMLLASPLTATAADVQIPEICKSVANYAAQSLAMNFADGTWGDGSNPASVTLKADPAGYPLTNIKFLGNCDLTPNLKPSWCRVAGGSPDVYELEVGKRWSATEVDPFATVVVTFNRGGCWVDSAERK